jgi:NAD kinase
MVFDRSFVLGASQVVGLEVVGDEPAILSADGLEGIELPVGSRIRIEAAPRPARLVVGPGGQDFLTRVREKFDLPGDPDVGGGG